MGADRLTLMPRFFMPVSTHLDHRFSRYLIIHSAPRRLLLKGLDFMGFLRPKMRRQQVLH